MTRPRVRLVNRDPWEPDDFVTERELDVLLAVAFVVGIAVGIAVGMLLGWAVL